MVMGTRVAAEKLELVVVVVANRFVPDTAESAQTVSVPVKPEALAGAPEVANGWPGFANEP